VIWLRTPDGTVHLRRIDPAGGPGATLDLTKPASGQADLAVDADGDAYVVWAAADSGDQLIYGRRIAAGGTLDPPEQLSDDTQISFSPQVAVDAAGVPTAAWFRADASIELRRATGATEVVAPAGTAANLGDLAVDGAGNATVAWPGPSGANQAVLVRHLPVAGLPGPVNDLWSGGDDHDPRLALDSAGTPTLIWANQSASGETIRLRSVPGGAAPGPIAELAAPQADVYVGNPALATAPDGTMTAIWRRLTATEETIAAARFATATATAPAPVPPAPDPAPPAPAPATAPPLACAPVTLGRLRAGARKRTGAKGVHARLGVDRAARLDVLTATLTYRRGGRMRTAKLRARDVTTSATASLRFRLPRRLGLDVGKRVTLRLRLRARATTSGCPYGATRTLELRAKVGRI
jgi:hypothetical protein